MGAIHFNPEYGDAYARKMALFRENNTGINSGGHSGTEGAQGISGSNPVVDGSQNVNGFTPGVDGSQGVNGVNIFAVDGGRFAPGSAEPAVSNVPYEQGPAFLATAQSGSYYRPGYLRVEIEPSPGFPSINPEFKTTAILKSLK